MTNARKGQKMTKRDELRRLRKILEREEQLLAEAMEILDKLMHPMLDEQGTYRTHDICKDGEVWRVTSKCIESGNPGTWKHVSTEKLAGD